MAEHGTVAVTQAIIWAFVALSTVSMIARLYTRFKIVNVSGLDDYLMGISLLCCIVFAILVTISAHWGMGQHTSSLSDEQQQNALLYSTASFTPGILSFTIPKLGVTALLVRILNPTPRFALFLWVFVGVSNLFIFGCIIILFAQCTPTKALWTPSLMAHPGVKCWDPDVLTFYSIAAGSLSAFLDLFLAVYPATVLHKLQMNKKKKLGLMIVLGMGVFACAISIYKATRLMGLDTHEDFTYTSFDVFLWTAIEGNTIVIAACIPTITPLLEAMFGRNVFRGRSAEQSSSYNNRKYLNRSPRHAVQRGDTSSSSADAADATQDQVEPYAPLVNSNSARVERIDRVERVEADIWKSSGNNTTEVSSSLSSSSSSSSSSPHKPRHIKNIVSQKTDVESQTSILNYTDDEDDDDDDDDHHHHHNHDDDDAARVHSDSIPLSQISRRDTFSVQYEDARQV